MPNLSGALHAAQGSLQAYSRGLAVVSSNIANANTPGYARQRPVIQPNFLPEGSLLGVEVRHVQTLRDNLLEYQLLSARSQQAQLSGLVDFYSLVEPSFRLDSPGSLETVVDELFTAAGRLAVNPTDTGLRQAFLGSADSLAASFRQASADLDEQSRTIEQDVQSTVSRINTLAADIAQLEVQRPTRDGEPNPGIETREHQALTELSELVGFSVQRQRDGTLTVVAGAQPIIVGAISRPLRVSADKGKITIVDSAGKDITATIQSQGGKLGALLEARNEVLPGLQADIDRLAKHVADNVNQQLQRGVDLNGAPGRPLFTYVESSVSGAGRAAGVTGAATPAPPVSVDVTFSNGLTGSISATLDSFFVGKPPTAPAAGDTASVRFTSADSSIDTTITTAPLLGGETTAELAARLNDKIALDPDLAGLVQFSDEGASLKAVLSETAGQGFSFAATTAGSPGFATGLEAGGSLGGHSAEEIAAALNAEIDINPDLSAAGVRFTAIQGELVLDGDVSFQFSFTDNDPAGTGFASGLDGVGGVAGGASAARSLSRAGLSTAQIATGLFGSPAANGNITAIQALADQPAIDGLTFTQFYARFTARLGDGAASAAVQLDTQQQIVSSAESFRDSVSGVDLNEEAIALMQLEEGYSAMLRVINLLDELSRQVIQLGR